MELRRYWRIVWRRWWLVAVLTLGVAATSLAVGPDAQPGYVASGRLLVSVAPEPPPQRAEYYRYDEYYNWLASEYLADDLVEVLSSRAFAEDVRAELGGALDAVAIQAALRTEKVHRILRFTITASDAAQAQATAAAIGRVIETKDGDYFAQLSEQRAMVRLIDPPSVAPQTTSSRRYLDIGLRTLLGLAAGVGLTLLLHYLDPTLRESSEVEALLGVPVLGEIPPA